MRKELTTEEKAVKLELAKQKNRVRNRKMYQTMDAKKRKARIEKQKKWNKENLEKQCTYVKKYQKNNSLKKIARVIATSIECPEGKVRHHFSYNVQDMKDVLFFTNEEHQYLHRYLKYQEHNKYFTTVGGILLDTKEKHDYYCTIILDFKPFVSDMEGFLKMFGY